MKTLSLLIFVGTFWAETQAQKISNLPSKNRLTAGIPKLPAKPEIPYLEELRQIQSLKKSYDSLRNELKELKEMKADSTQRDSFFTLAKDRSKQVMEQESKTLESLIASEEIPGEEIKNAAKTTPRLRRRSGDDRPWGDSPLREVQSYDPIPIGGSFGKRPPKERGS